MFAIVDSGWLRDAGLSRKQQSLQAHQGSLTRISQGVYQKAPGGHLPSAEVDAFTLLLSAQNLHGIPAHLGGASALSLQGMSHYLPMGGTAPLLVYAAAPPAWLLRTPSSPKLLFRKTGLLRSDSGINTVSPLSHRVFSPDPDWKLEISGPERALLELIDELPDRTSFHLVDTAFESAVNLRPRLVSGLLRDCTSVKAKRLFMVFAERHAHSWLKHVSLSEVDFGSGKRSVVPGGRLNEKYAITLPDSYVPREEDDHEPDL